jgi:hypothetical protein
MIITSPFVDFIIKIECSNSSILFNNVCKRNPCSVVVNTTTGCDKLKRTGNQFHNVKNYLVKLIIQF